MAVMTYSSLFLTLNWNARWINQKCRQHPANFGVYNEGFFSFLKPEAKLNSKKTMTEIPQKVHKRPWGESLSCLETHIIKELNKQPTKTIRQRQREN